MDDLSMRILSYLADNPEANDTVEGITQWWLLEREIREERTRVERSLSALAAAGWLEEVRGGDSRSRYRLHPERADEVRDLLARRDP